MDRNNTLVPMWAGNLVVPQSQGAGEEIAVQDPPSHPLDMALSGGPREFLDYFRRKMDDIERLQKRAESAEKERDNLREAVNDAEKERDDLREAVNDAEKERDNLRETVNDAEKERDVLKEVAKGAESDRNEMAEKVKRLTERLEVTEAFNVKLVENCGLAKQFQELRSRGLSNQEMMQKGMSVIEELPKYQRQQLEAEVKRVVPRKCNWKLVVAAVVIGVAVGVTLVTCPGLGVAVAVGIGGKIAVGSLVGAGAASAVYVAGSNCPKMESS